MGKSIGVGKHMGMGIGMHSVLSRDMRRVCIET